MSAGAKVNQALPSAPPSAPPACGAASDFWSRSREHWAPEILYRALGLPSPWDVADPSAVRQEESGQFLLDRRALTCICI